MVIINSQPNDKPTASEIGAVPVSRTVNGKSLNNDITLTANDVGAIGGDNVYTKNQTLTNATKSMYNLPDFADPNMIFQKLAMPYGYYGFDITVVSSDNEPIPYVVLNGLEDFNGNTPITDENGRYPMAMINSSAVTVTINNYIGLQDYSINLTSNSNYIFTPCKIIVPIDYTARKITSTTTTKIFVPNDSFVDLCCVGGGGGGGYGTTDYAGAGGGGGYATNLLGNTTIKTGTITTSIAGGGGGATGIRTGGNGGTTTVSYNGEVLLTATGGYGGPTVNWNYSGVDGGIGNGNGGRSYGGATSGSGMTGGNATVYLFNDSSLGLAGGGGGGAGPNGAAGGSPYGGTAGRGNQAGAYGGQGPGGGGGGGAYGSGGSGASGCVYIRIRKK